MQLFKFGDLVGNGKILVPLKNLLSKNRLPNFNIFGGDFGMGKTTAAIIAAMRVTCDYPEGAEPCLKCEVCKTNMNSLTSSGKNLYVNKINMGFIETTKQMEDLVTSVFSQRGHAGKIAYILEEFQSLDTRLQEKMLEQLDRLDSSIYIFITCTDLHKVIDTIKSRTLPFIFTRFSDEESKLLAIRECKRLGIDNPSAGFIDLIVRSSEGVARNISKLVEFTKLSELTEETLRDFLGEVPVPVYTLMIDLMVRDESMFIKHLESTLINYSTQPFIKGFKVFTEKTIFLRRTGDSEYFTDEESTALKGYTEDVISKVHKLAMRLNSDFSNTDVRLHFIGLLESLRDKSVLKANAEKASLQSERAARANIENKSLNYSMDKDTEGDSDTKIKSFEKEVSLESLREMRKK